MRIADARKLVNGVFLKVVGPFEHRQNCSPVSTESGSLAMAAYQDGRLGFGLDFVICLLLAGIGSKLGSIADALQDIKREIKNE